MKRLIAAMAAALTLGSCSAGDHRTHLYLQRFFGECGAEYGNSTDIAKAEGECGIITTMIARFNAENPDVRVDVNVVAWPGYPQLTAQMAARDPPDLVTMHEGVITDYAAKGLLEPVDGYLQKAGISPADFTDASRAGVTIGDKIYGMPWDTHGGLFHVNTALFAKAGLMRGDKPVLPTSAAELIAQGHQFEQRTGKPYLIQSLVGDPAGAARNQYTYMMAQGAVLFPDPHHVKLATPLGQHVAAFFKRINDEHLGTLNMDTPAAIAAFMNGEGGIYPTGTWMIGSFARSIKAMPFFPTRACGASASSSSVATRGWSRRASGHPSSAPPSRASSNLWRRTISTGRARAISRRSSRCSPTRASRPCRTARTSRRWQRSAGRCPATCSAKARSRESSAKKPMRRSLDKSPSRARSATRNAASTRCWGN